jgi:hypothetical protein
LPLAEKKKKTNKQTKTIAFGPSLDQAPYLLIRRKKCNQLRHKTESKKLLPTEYLPVIYLDL